MTEHSNDIAVLAGGQSLMPLLNFRMSRPAVVLDINNIPELRDVRCENGILCIGSMVRHCHVERDEIFRSTVPLMCEATASVAHIQIKTRGTLGGNLCNAHPASEMPAVMTVLDAAFVCKSEVRGERILSPEEFFEGALQNNLASDELLCEIRVPVPRPDIGWAFEEISRRHGDLAQCGAAVLIGAESGRIHFARAAVCGIDEVPSRLGDLEKWLIGKSIEDGLPREVQRFCRDRLAVAADITMTAENKARVASAVIARSVERAAVRALDVDMKG